MNTSLTAADVVWAAENVLDGRNATLVCFRSESKTTDLEGKAVLLVFAIQYDQHARGS